MEKTFIVGAEREAEQKKLNAALAKGAEVRDVHASPGSATWLVVITIPDKDEDEDE